MFVINRGLMLSFLVIDLIKSMMVVKKGVIRAVIIKFDITLLE
jgi:hypothetical protein